MELHVSDTREILRLNRFLLFVRKQQSETYLEDLYKSIDVMKDKKPKLRELHAANCIQEKLIYSIRKVNMFRGTTLCFLDGPVFFSSPFFRLGGCSPSSSLAANVHETCGNYELRAQRPQYPIVGRSV